MAAGRSSKLAVILHADVAGSTALVQSHEQLAHERILATFQRFDSTIRKYRGRVRELRGDALLAEFERASDAVTAALAFQSDQHGRHSPPSDHLTPKVRMGIAMGEVIIADDTITGAGVVLAQRLEQLAQPGGVVIQSAAYETIPGRFPFEYDYLGEHEVKGFVDPVRVYSPRLKQHAELPRSSAPSRIPGSKGVVLAAVAITAICVAGASVWLWRFDRPGFEPADPASMAYSLPDSPSLAVLPFDNLTDDDANQYLADGFVDSLITELSRHPDLLVIARNSSFSFRDKKKEPNEVAEALGVRYIVEGSFQRLGERLRINVQLVDAIQGYQVWSERYDRPASDFYRIQDQLLDDLVLEIAGRGGGVFLAERRRVKSRESIDLRVMELWEKASQAFFTYTREGNEKTRVYARELIDRAPQQSRGYIALAWYHLAQVWNGWSETPATDLSRGCELADRAIELNRADYQGHWARAWCKATGGRPDDAVPAMRRALELNPNDVLLQRDYAKLVLQHEGRFDEAIVVLERFLRLNPAQHRFVHQRLGDIYMQAGKFEAAARHYQQESIQAPFVRARLVAALVMSGQDQRAREAAAELLRLSPKFSAQTLLTSDLSIPDQSLVEQIISALVRAGIPEHPSS